MDGYDGYVLDLDGTIYLDDELLPGARETIAALRARGAAIVFATNKPIETTAQYAEKLTRLGIPAEDRDIVTAIDSLLRYLDDCHPDARLLLIAEEVVAAALRDHGFTLVGEPEEADVVVVSFDRTFDYAKLHAAYRAVRHHGARIVATNPDPTCPTADGGLPDCAAMLAALEACTGASADAVLGKPSRWMAESCVERLGVAAERVAVVGDRFTDVALGQRIGATGVLLLSGATAAADIERSDLTPDLVLASIGELLPRDPDRTDPP